MRILRLRLRNYRGVAEREVRLAPSGVTLLVGPNEIGKSSLAEAIDLLFDELDSTTKRRVRDVQPVDRDAGAEIEADIESGAYAFTYRKRFQRRPETRLTVTRPRVENLTGREAHRRAHEILEATLDTQLWRALRVQQGQGLVQASWLGAPALASALDRAAGSVDDGVEADGADTLVEAVEAEALRYFTPTGRERRTLAAAAREAERARQAETDARDALERLEEDVRRAEELRALRAALEQRDRAAELRLREEERAFAPVAALRESLDTAETRREAARTLEQEAARAARQRGQLLASLAAAEADLAQRSEEIERGEPALLGLRAELDHAERGRAQARAALEAASTSDARLRADLDFRRAERELEALEARARRIAAARAEVETARAEVGDDALDEDALRRVREAELAMERARTRVDSEGPLVRLVAHAPLDASVDGRSARLEEGAILEQRVGESLLLSLPGVADVTVVAGAGAAARVKQHEEARTRWRQLCAECGIEDHADGIRRLAARREAGRRLADREALLADLCGDGDEAVLAARIETLRARTRAYASERAGPLPLPDDPDQAERELFAARADFEQARRARDQAERRWEALLERHRRLAEQHRETTLRLELARQSVEDVEERLARARAECSDEELERRRDAHAARARPLAQERREAAARLAEADPEAAQARLEGARRARERAARELARVREEATLVAARLEVRGEQGLYDALERARADALRLRRADEGLRRRARAAALLRETLREERDAARRGYAEPLARRIGELGRLVFGESFAVELDEELRVARRIHEGLSLPFDQLSAGAREQIALIARLAVATLVGRDGGAPLILDDALGHSDPERLARVGRALAEAAPACQILVLTCTPDRYRHVDGARVVTLAADAARDA